MLALKLLLCRSFGALLLLLLAPASGAMAQGGRAGGEPAAGEQEEFVLRTYEVGDLVVNVPDYTSGPSDESAVPGGMGGGGFGGGGGGFGGGGQGGGFFSVPDGDTPTGSLERPSLRGRHPEIIFAQFGGGGGRGGRETRVAADPMPIDFDSLIDAMTAVVAPDTWQENGTGRGDVRVVGAALVVWQTADVHERIAGFLDQLRQGSAKRRSVAIDARWLLLNSDDLDRLFSPGEDGDPAVDRDVLAECTRRATSLRGITNCFSGQRVYLISGTRRAVVSGYIPVVGSIEAPGDDAALAYLASESNIVLTQYGGEGGAGGGRSVGYQPIVEKPNFGALLEIRPTLMQDDEAAVVDLTSTITFGGPDAEVAAAPAAPLIDRVAVAGQELATTLRVPLGEPTLVGGMSVLGQPEAAVDDEAQNAPEQEVQQLYLVLEIR